MQPSSGRRTRLRKVWRHRRTSGAQTRHDHTYRVHRTLVHRVRRRSSPARCRMTRISRAAQARQDAARERRSGRFGAQHHTAPVGGFPGRRDWAAMDDAGRCETIEADISAVIAERGLDGWGVEWNAAWKTLGSANLRDKRITLSVRQLHDEALTRDTAMHEAAHAIAGARAGHGPAWQAVARQLGAQPEARAEALSVARPRVSKRVETRYGPLDIDEGATAVTIGGTEYTVWEVRQSKAVVERGDGQRFRVTLDQLHPDYGDLAKLTHGRTKRVATPYGALEITEGRTRFRRGSTEYTVVEILQKSVIAQNERGTRVKLDLELVHPDANDVERHLEVAMQRARERVESRRRRA